MAASWLTAGKAAQQEMDKPVVYSGGRKTFRFSVPEGGETLITFLDGALIVEKETQEKYYDATGAWEHGFMTEGRFTPYMCTAPVEGRCYLCETNKMKNFNLYFTVIDHTKVVMNSGKVFQHDKKLFVARKETITIIQKLVGDLVGTTVEVTRSGKKSAPVGSLFLPKEHNTLDRVSAKYGVDTSVLDYEKELNYMSYDDVRKLFIVTDTGSKPNEPREHSEAATQRIAEDEIPF